MLLVTENTVNNELPDSQPEWSSGPVGVALPHTPEGERERGEQQHRNILSKVPVRSRERERVCVCVCVCVCTCTCKEECTYVCVCVCVSVYTVCIQCV